MTAHQRRAARVQHLNGAGHDLIKLLLDDLLAPIGHRRDRHGRLRVRAHRVDIAQTVVRRDFAEHVGVVEKGAKVIHALHQYLARGHFDHGGVVRLVQADEHVVAFERREPIHNARQHRAADLRAATAAAHGDHG